MCGPNCSKIVQNYLFGAWWGCIYHDSMTVLQTTIPWKGGISACEKGSCLGRLLFNICQISE